jgi:DNA-binding CsgD family transcriptional regulator
MHGQGATPVSRFTLEQVLDHLLLALADAHPAVIAGSPVSVPSPPRAVPDWSRLTKGERRVVELVAHGLTNPEISRALVLSVRTIESHVANVRAKLGFPSRRALARAAALGMDDGTAGFRSDY